MRTAQEIIDRIESIKSTDFFGSETYDLLVCLPFEDARPYLKDDATEDGWPGEEASIEAITQRLREYMPFAWGKANNCRGLSAARSLDHMRAWLWLLGDLMYAELDEYTYYGKPQLRMICEKYGVDWRELDDGCWRTSEFDEGVSAEQVL